MTPEQITRTLEMLDAGEDLSILIGSGPRPSELKLGQPMQRKLRAMLRKALHHELQPVESDNG